MQVGRPNWATIRLRCFANDPAERYRDAEILAAARNDRD